MSIFNKYKVFHGKGTKLIPFQVHAGMAFFFTTIAGSYWWIIAPLMIAVIAGKEYMDMKTSNGLPYSWFDLGSWGAGVVLAFLSYTFITY